MNLHKFRSLASANTAIAAAVLASSTCISAAVLPPELNWSTASAEVDVQGLAFQLIDLDANDGITPQITFAEGYLLLDALSGFQATDSYLEATWYGQTDTNSPLSANDIQLQTTGGGSFSSISANSLYAGAGSSEALIDAHALRDSTTDWDYESSSSGQVGAKPLVGYNPNGSAALITTDNQHYELGTYDDGMPPSFTLTPNTAVVFSGVLSSKVRLDLTQLNTIDPQTVYGLVIAYGKIELFGTTSNDGNTAWSSFEDALVAVEGQQASTRVLIERNHNPYGLYMAPLPEWVVGPETTFMEHQDSKAFELMFSNQTLQAKDGYLSANINAYIDIGGRTYVPEPATYALMGLGLLGVLGAVRRRQA
jgi:PEP-CTERM motif